MNATEWDEQALSLVRKVVLVPSSYNTQPWLSRVAKSDIDLLADRTRALPVNYPEYRELAISCGCSLMNLRVAAAHRRFRIEVQLSYPNAGELDWLAPVCCLTPAAADVRSACS